MMAAAIEYLGRKQRALKPRGEVRGSGWWPGPQEVQTCCAKTPYPDGYNTWVKLKHCCTGPHVALLYKCDEKSLKQWSRRLESAGAKLRREHYTLLWQLRKQSDPVSMDDILDVIHLWEKESQLSSIMGMKSQTRKLAVELVKSGMEQADAIASAQALAR
jgi:hypothetical protein